MELSKKFMAPAKAKTGRKLYSASEMIQQKKNKRLMAAEPERVAPDVFPKISSNLSKNDIMNRLKEMTGLACPTNEDKFQLLRRRDELMSKLRDLISAEPGTRKITQGTCPDMCPEKERYMRDVKKNIHFYECDSRGQMVHEKMVKDYSRSAADQDMPLAHELRPLDTLQMTMDYLIFKIADEMPNTNTELARWYDFLWSRTRAIRKDITQQMLQTESAVDLVEKCVRLHIFASFKLASLDAELFDDKINTENLSKSMQTLRHMYEDLAKSQRHCPNESEFRSYDIILNLTDFNVHAQVLSYRSAVRESPQVKLALNLASALQNNNFVHFFRLVRSQVTFLQSCLCFQFFSLVRSNALKVICLAYHTFPVDTFVHNLAFDSSEQAIAFLFAFKMELDATDSNWINTKDGKYVFMAGGEAPAPSALPYFSCAWIENKSIGSSLSQILCNSPTAITAPKLRNAPINSFSPNSNVYANDPVLDTIFTEHRIGSNGTTANRQKNGFQQQQSSPGQQHPLIGFVVQPLALAQQKQPSLLQRFSFTKALQFPQFQSAIKIPRPNVASTEFVNIHTESLLEKVILGNLNSIGRTQLDKFVQTKLAKIRARLRRNWLRQYVQRWILFIKRRRYYRLANRWSEVLLTKIVADQLAQQSILAHRKALQLQFQQLAESIASEQGNKILEKILGEQLYCCACRVQANQVRDIQQRLGRIRENLFTQWLRQFTDHWLGVVRRNRLLRSISTIHTPACPSEARLSSPTNRLYHPELKKLTPEAIKAMAEQKMRQIEEAKQRKVAAEEAERKRKAEEENNVSILDEDEEDVLNGEFVWSHLSIYSKRIKLSYR